MWGLRLGISVEYFSFLSDHKNLYCSRLLNASACVDVTQSTSQSM